MKFKRTINVSGSVTIDTVPVSVNFTYSDVPPIAVNFSLSKDNCSVSGECGIEGIKNYYVGQGIITDEFMKLLETECKRILTNYETV